MAYRAPRSSPCLCGSPLVSRAVGPGAEANLKRYDKIIKSPEDKRDYRGLELPNKLKVLLVSDPQTDKSAAALDVNVGYLSDPDELPGLAHFCEHMLFLGTVKYPEENHYNKFVTSNGGTSNAATSSDHTTYYFDILPEYLPQALDIFAQFFLAPLFAPEATEREVSAVNSEHEKNLAADAWRLDQLAKHTANPEHPYHKFGTGNKNTLETIPKSMGLDLRKELLKFHSKWYSSNIMCLSVVGKESLDELEHLVVPLFSKIENKSVVVPEWLEHPYPPELRRKRAFVVPVRDYRSLSVDFPVPDTRLDYKSAASHYVSHLLGHEGPGSLLAALKEKGWCNALVCGSRTGGRGFATFGLQVDLTENALDHIDDVAEMVFQYLKLLRTSGPQRWIWEEQKDLSAIDFRFKDVQEPRNFVVSHVHLLQDFPMDDVLSAYYLLTEWKPELIEDFINLLTVENVRVGVVSKTFEKRCTMTEPWYKTKYVLEDIPKETLERWSSADPPSNLHLPEPNSFIPSRLDLDKCPDVDTHILKDSNFLRLWYRGDDEFGLPKAVMTFDLVSPLAYSEPINCCLTAIWALMIRDQLQQSLYAADLAGLRWSLYNTKNGLTMSIEGYDDKQHILLDKILCQIVNFKANKERFPVLLEAHIRALKNWPTEQPYQHAVYQLALCLTFRSFSKEALLDASMHLTPELLDDFVPRFIRRIHVEGLVCGNMTKERAMKIAQNIECKIPSDAIPLLPQQLLLNRDVEIDKGALYLRRIENSIHSSSCTSVYVCTGMPKGCNRVLLDLLAQMVEEPAFTVLRTKEQLGYVVWSGPRRGGNSQGLRVLVQGDYSVEYLHDRIDLFLDSMKEILNEMTDEEFLKHRSTLKAQLLEKPKRLASRAAIIWSEISSQVYNFERSKHEADMLDTITRKDLIDFYNKHIHSSSQTRRSLTVYIASTLGDKEKMNEEVKDEVNDDRRKVSTIVDLLEFKSGRRLCPLPTPFIKVPRKGTQSKL